MYDLTQHENIELVSMGDLHLTSYHADHDMVRSAVTWLSEAENRYAFVPGDIFDTAIKGSISLDLSEVGMSTMDGRHLLQRILQPVASRILCVLPGNHDDRSRRDTGEDSVDALMCALGIGDRYFPDGEAFIQLKVGAQKHTRGENTAPQPCTYNCYVTHGNAGGRMPGGKVNSLVGLRTIIHNCDAYFNGHGHDPVVKPEVAWEIGTQGYVRERKQLFVSCGSSLKRAGYPVKKGFPPLARVWPTVTFHGDFKHMSAHIEH